MKRLLAMLLLAALLCGCGPRPPVNPTESTESAATEPTVRTEPTEPAESLLSKATPWRGDETLLELPLEQLKDNPYCSSIDLVGDRILLGNALYETPDTSETGEDEEFTDMLVGFRFTSIDARTGKTVAIREFDGAGYMTPQQLGDNVGICDNFSGSVWLLDPDLNLLKHWEREPDDCSWYLGYRGGRAVLYRFGFERDCTAEDLETGETEVIFNRNPSLWVMAQGENTIYAPIVTQPNWMRTMAEVNLVTGEICTVPGGVPASDGVRAGDRWFCWEYGDNGMTGTVVDGDRVRTTQVEKGSLQLLQNGRFLLSDEDSLRLCDGEGRLLDMCRPQTEQESLWTWNIRYSDLFGGYLMRLDGSEGQQHLLLWQAGDEPGEQVLHFEDRDDLAPTPRGSAVSQELYERAEQIGAQYGVEVLIADQYQVPNVPYTVELMTDEEMISSGLDLLEEVLASYPEGFFRQLRWRNIQKMQIYLTGYIYPGETHTIGGGYSAFAHEYGNACLVAMDVHGQAAYIYGHEFSHLIDRKLQRDAGCRADSDYSEAKWESFNPEGFEYTYDYGNVPGYFEDQSMYAWFASPYATVNATEDRATVMESAIGVDWAFWDAPGMQAKMRYYCACIRDGFDTSGWPEVTLWEKVLETFDE